jgi:hypothetical protein
MGCFDRRGIEKGLKDLGGSILVVLLCAEVSSPLFAQAPVVGSNGAVRIIGTDMAVLETQDIRKDLPCSVMPIKPVLGFDLRFHAGYEVSVQLKELAGSENQLTILFRVTQDNHKDEPYYFMQKMRVPPLADDAHGEATWQGAIDLGEGNFHVDWLMRDRAERVCSFYWDMDVFLPAKDKQMALEIQPGFVQRAEWEQFIEEPPVERTQNAQPLNVKVLVNFAPQNAGAAAMRPMDTQALVSILRRISREPQFAKFSLVAFNIQEQKVLYRQRSANRIDFPALGEAINGVKLGTVDPKRLANKHGDTEFLTDLIQKEMRSDDHPDALIFAGPKIMLDESMPQDALKPFASDLDYPVFYMNYTLNPQAQPWKDSISRAVKIFKGTEYTISRPRDLWFAVSEMVSHIVKLKHGKNSLPISSQ